MVKDHSDSEKRNPLPPHRLLLSINSKGSVISHRQDNTYYGLCYTSRGALAGTRNSSMGPPHEGSIRRPIAPSRSYTDYTKGTTYSDHRRRGSRYSSRCTERSESYTDTVSCRPGGRCTVPHMTLK